MDIGTPDVHERGLPRKHLDTGQVGELEPAASTDENTNPPTEPVEPEDSPDQAGDGPASTKLVAADMTAEDDADALNAQPIGQVDSSDYPDIRGWAWHPHMPDEPIDIEILADDVMILKMRADEFRPDLLSADVGNGRHGFRVEGLGTSVLSGTREVRVRRADDHRDLRGSPMSTTRSDPVTRDGTGGAEFEFADSSKREDHALAEIARNCSPHPGQCLSG